MTRIRLLIITFGFAAILSAAPAAAQDSGVALRHFAEGNMAYKEGRYADAVVRYEQVLAEGQESGPLYYNLGNSYFKKGDLGKAILNYERALQLLPRDADVRANYRYAQSLSKTRFAGRPQTFWQQLWYRHIQFYTLNEMTMMIFSLVLTAGVVFLLSLYLSWPRLPVNVIIAVCGFLTIIFVMGLGMKWQRLDDLCVITQTSDARFEPREQATTHFAIAAGAHVTWLKTEDQWVKIRRPDGKAGWVPAATVEKVILGL